jgi:ribA/ribD-fused uncharacterized protein
MTLSIRQYKKSECITFKSTKGEFGALSNMAPGFPLHIDGIIIKNSEALYQALRFPDFPEIQSKIISFPSPISAKKFGREHIDKSRSDWNQNRFKIMKFCLELKLHQNIDTFSKILLQTKELPIVEYTEIDKVWGATDEGEFYSGTNALGRLLMELRENLKHNTFSLTIPDIHDLRLLNKEITMETINSAPNTRS